MIMSRIQKLTSTGLALALILVLSACTKTRQSADDPDKTASRSGVLSDLLSLPEPIVVPEGTNLTVSLDQAISSGQNRSGDKFQATVVEPIVIDHKTVIPRDARAEGHVVEAKASGRLSGVPKLDLTLDSVEVNGKMYDLSTDDEGRVGKNHNKRNAILIGGGTAFGALVGGLAGGGKGALIGGAGGAGAGTAGAAYTGKKDIHIPAETQLTFQLTRPVAIPVKS